MVKIDNRDNLCLPRALVVAKAHVDKDSEYVKVRRNIRKIQTQRALELCRNANVSIPEEGAGIPELQVLQRYLSGYKIVVYSYGSKGREVIFSGSGNEGAALNLFHHEGHYNVITSLTAAFCCSYYCERCNIPYDHKNKHRCGGTCPCCQQSPTCPPALKVLCDYCKRSFRGQDCYKNHRKSGSLGKSTVCEQITCCETCLKTVKTDRKHLCGEIFCKTCSAFVPQDHMCFIQTDKGSPKTKDFLFIFYDFETRQEKQQDDGSLLHKPNLCVLKQCCDECINKDIKICKKCGVRLQVLQCGDPVSPFMHHLLTLRKQFKQVVVLAHNSQSFDGQFILNYILTKTDLKPELIMRGTKIISMEVENVKFLDSLNYLPMALSKLPKAFDLGPELKKGYFPHYFNTEANQNYIGLLPPQEYYSPDTMKTEDREKFLQWYEEHKNDEFNMQKDIVEYCVSDVEILTRACLKFRQQLMETTNVCPFTEACTIASTCNKVFRRNFLKPNTIGIIPKSGYRWRDNQSKIAIQWLVWEEKQRNVNIQHAAKQQEATIHGVKVDGFCSETEEVFEFHGCYYHGCPSCFKCNRGEPLQDNPAETMDLRHESTISKTDRLKNLGYEVIEMWECQFRKMLQDNDELRVYSGGHPLVTLTPLNPREAFYGGRTGNTRTYYKCQQGEKIKYVDVCSLYPYVCKYGKFPVGHPEIYVGDNLDQLSLNNTNGVIKCKILPPRELYHPVLPTKMNGKLMFVLCRTCGEEMNQGECTHNVDERSLTGAWIIDEVLKALEKGYKILDVYEIWKYSTQQYDKTTNISGLFTDMMNKFIKIKQQASGWPSKCVSQEQKNQYIGDFFNNEGIKLEFAEIVNNPGLRSLAKLILNSFWGKFGQRENQPKTRIVRDPSELFGMFANPGIYVNTLLPINDETLVVNYEHREEVYQPLSTVNVVTAAYVTAQARLKLYGYLEQLGDKVLYYDTDSVIYVSKPGEFDVPTGEFVGDMTDELESYGFDNYITEFVSGGPKNYAYKVFSTRDNEQKVVCKVKGICLNYATSHLINFESIKDMVLNDAAPVHIVSKNIRRTKEHEVVTITETKTYKPNSTKRMFLDDHNSIPYGYKKQRTIS
ncbi:uncharacterized protein LOC108910461 [Anoplophora glabripennis]|uniref:uncharacterized protein LOC108910461 n=1 Tax=Anoplophora glabripennis TaxID=217634 RepID=UPI000C783D26|nr:uncharacterized protein LOC108910461 [Anoplophora glabripennis]